MSDRQAGREAAILVSGGIDSAVLAAEMAREFSRVQPIYVRFGLRWEAAELDGLRSFLEVLADDRLAPLVILEEPIADVYGDHWSVRGPSVPGSGSTDEAVHLPGRNLLLIAKASVWCRLRGIEILALGNLASNPFPDSTPDFYRAMEETLRLGLGGPVRLVRPFEKLGKAEVILRGRGLPIASTISCLDPVEGLHCGSCNKCEERRRGFRSVGTPDPTRYAVSR